MISPTAAEVDRAVQAVLNRNGSPMRGLITPRHGSNPSLPNACTQPASSGSTHAFTSLTGLPPTTPRSDLVETLVHAVLQRLATLDMPRASLVPEPTSPSRPASPGPSPAPLPASSGGDPGSIPFTGRLFTEKHALALPAGTQSLHLPPGVVVTPLAREHLKRAGVLIRWGSGDSTGNSAAHHARLAFAWEVESGLAPALRRSLAAEPVAWIEQPGSLDELAPWLKYQPGRAAVLFTPDPARAVFNAITRHQLRAACVGDVPSATRAIRSIQAELLAVDPAGMALTELRQICAAIPRAGTANLPGGPPS